MVSQAGRCIALIERITHRHKREPQASSRTPGAPGKPLYLLPQTRLLAGRQSCRGMGVPPSRLFVLNMT
jgi:hypothetical protein